MVASLVWNRLGNVDNYIEPFAGSLAVLLARPHEPKVETVNDLDSYVANFWRATTRDPEAVVAHCDWPVNEVDLHSRHRWLVLSNDAAAFRERMRADPEYFDPKIAGWWCWGLCQWIGSGWCNASQYERHKNQRPQINEGRNLHATSQNRRPQLADAHSRGRGVHANDAASVCAERRAWLFDWFGRLRDRLRVVRVCCGDWSRVCSSESTTTGLGLTGVFLDPPYGDAAGRTDNIYSVDSLSVAQDVRKWCIANGQNPLMRIALCGYAGEGHEDLESHGWECVPWKAQGGYGNRSAKGKENAGKERIWFSPHCVPEASLFSGLSQAE